MFSPKASEIYTAPLDEDSVEACRKTSCGVKQASVHLNRTLPSLLDEGRDFDQSMSSNRSLFSRRWRFRRKKSAAATINQYGDGNWQSWTLTALSRIADEVALSLQQYSPIKKGDRAALLMDSNVPFVMADIGCLLAQLVTVPMSPEQPLDIIEYMLKETEASVLFVSGWKQVKQLLSTIPTLTALRLIVVAEDADDSTIKTALDRLEAFQRSLPKTIELTTLATLREKVDWSEEKAQMLRAQLDPQDLATIVYTLGDDGRPLGAMLTHENLSGSALAAFHTLPCLRKGAKEVALSFLPLHHIFARGFVYGSLSFGQSLYFSSPRRVARHLRELKPTIFFTVPRQLEKIYESWQAFVFPEAALNQTPFQRRLFLQPKQMLLSWAWGLVSRYQLNDPQSVGYRVQLWAARQTVLRPLRILFGGRMRCFISGGAALPAEAMTLMSAAGLKLCQGYGLTEASSTLSFTRRHWKQAGTVGVPMPGVELALAPDGEVMAKAPYVMQGYYRNPEATRTVLEENGWLHTGDRGEFSPEGLLTLTGQKKKLFKLSVGEYVAPIPIEQALQESPLIQRALVVGPGRKFCGLLIFPDIAALTAHAQQLELDVPSSQLIEQVQVVALYQALVDRINASLPFWSTVKRFRLVDAELSLERKEQRSHLSSDLLAADRDALYALFAPEIEALYQIGRKASQINDLGKVSAPASILQSASETIHQISMLLPSILSLKKERQNHV